MIGEAWEAAGSTSAPRGIFGLNRRLANIFGKNAPKAESVDEITDLLEIMKNGGDGTRGGLILKLPKGRHIINVVNEGGTIKFYDFQKAAATLDEAILSTTEQQQFFTKSSEMHFVNMSNIIY
ncbi:MAG: toxin glutamine deamidase domain-containing protein [Bacteroidota bacterium]